MATRSFTLPLLLFAVCSSACTTAAPDPCAFDEVRLPADFLGDAFGRGEVTVERKPDGELVGRVVLAQMEGQDNEAQGAALDIAGSAMCVDGLVKVELGAGVTRDGQLKVLGGEVHVVLARPGLVEQPFGTWRAELQRDEWPKPRQMSGPWTASTSKRAIAKR